MIKKTVKGRPLETIMKNRDFDYDVLPEIQTRWSPRAFDPNRPVADEDLSAIFEAARYAPSCFNEQPWLYLVSRDEETRRKILDCLTESNRKWTKNAPVLVIMMSKSTFAHNQKKNRWHQFDTGTSWGYLTLEAERRGLITHGMGGFSVDKVRETFKVPEDITIIAALAIGYYGDKDQLPAEIKAREFPQPRKPLADMFFVPEE